MYLHRLLYYEFKLLNCHQNFKSHYFFNYFILFNKLKLNINKNLFGLSIIAFCEKSSPNLKTDSRVQQKLAKSDRQLLLFLEFDF